jgi:hypothetical protein
VRLEVLVVGQGGVRERARERQRERQREIESERN